VALSGIVGGVIGAAAAIIAVLINAKIQKKNDRIEGFESDVFQLYKDLLFFRSNHTHIVKWDEDKGPDRDIGWTSGACDLEHPNYKTAVERFKAQRYEILDLLREIKTLEVRGHKLDENLSKKIVRSLFSLKFATEKERQAELDSCIKVLQEEWPTIDEQMDEVSGENNRLRESKPDEYARRFRLVEGLDEEVY